MNGLNWNDFKHTISDYVGVDESDITEETDVYDDLYLDSLGLFGLGAHITDSYKLNIPLSLVAAISKVGEIFTLLNEKGTPIRR